MISVDVKHHVYLLPDSLQLTYMGGRGGGEREREIDTQRGVEREGKRNRETNRHTRREESERGF